MRCTCRQRWWRKRRTTAQKMPCQKSRNAFEFWWTTSARKTCNKQNSWWPSGIANNTVVAVPFSNEKSDWGQKGHNSNHSGKMAGTRVHIHNTYFCVLVLQKEPSGRGDTSKNNDGEELQIKCYMTFYNAAIKIKGPKWKCDLHDHQHSHWAYH